MRSLTKRRNPQRLRRLPRFTRETKPNNAFASFCMVVKSILVAQMREVGFLVPKFFMSSLTMTNTFTVQRKQIAVHGYRLASHVAVNVTKYSCKDRKATHDPLSR